MSKAPEEGRIWEWRAFGTLPAELVEPIQLKPIRMGIRDLSGEDIYLVSPVSDQNVKLRLSQSDWLLKFKLLLETHDKQFELYEESARYTYSLPVSASVVTEAAQLLRVQLPSDFDSRARFDLARLISILGRATPHVGVASTRKRRSQFTVEGGWIELATVSFTSFDTQSVSVNSTELQNVVDNVAMLKAPSSLEVMNYIQACRRWGLS